MPGRGRAAALARPAPPGPSAPCPTRACTRTHRWPECKGDRAGPVAVVALDAAVALVNVQDADGEHVRLARLLARVLDRFPDQLDQPVSTMDLMDDRG